MLEKVQGLSLKDRFNFCFAPINIRDPKAMYHLLRFASTYNQNIPVNIAMGMPKCSTRNDSKLLDLETKHQVFSMYMWLSNHFKEETFPYVKKVEAMATDIADLLGQSLTKANWKPESRQAGKPKPQRKEDAPCKFPSQTLKFKASATLYAKPFSSSSAPNGDDDHGVSSLTIVESESECDFDADVGKATVGLLHSLESLDDDDDKGCSTVGDSTMVELGNDKNEEGIVVDSMVGSDNNNDVGLEWCEGHLNVASRDPVEVYRELRNAEKGAKQTRCD
nr:isoform 2 of atp-dependent rna helicase suv3l, mitochondrial [Quercus suber]